MLLLNFKLFSSRFLLFVFVCILSVTKLAATHIIGGEITYSCLGDNKYEVKLTVFRDCYNGVPYFDDTVSIGIFNFKNELIYDLRIPRMNDDTIHQTLVGTCLAIPPNVCVHTSIYTDTIELKPILGGYTLVYQRCCRNKTIANLIKPDETGASFIINISEKALLECNSSPKFKSWPPIYICANEPIHYDHSAIDQDGDSIVYKLCTPTNGLDVNPQPQPPNNPPYNLVDWKDPPYNLNNLLGGIPLAIDPHTGLLTGTPNTIGQFVVGICIEEYRDGEIISTTTRDFQYNVGLCIPTSSSFFVPDINCDTLLVQFTNQSASANKFYWDFGDPTTTNDNSTAIDPGYKYPEPGTYHVTLIAKVEGSPTCVDTFEKDIKVLKNTLVPDFKIKLLSCTDTLRVQFTDNTKDTANNQIISHKYYFRVGGKLIDSSTLSNPVFSYWQNVNTWEITLVVENELGCVKQRRKNIVFPKIIKFEFPTDTIVKCQNDTLYLNLPVDSNYVYTWTPGTYLSATDTVNPFITAPVSISYNLHIKDKNSICNLDRDLYIQVPPLIELMFPDTIVTCEKNITVPLISNIQGLKIDYSNTSDFTSIIDTGYTLDIKNLKGTHRYYVRASDPFGCEAKDSVLITGNAIYITPFPLRLLCPGVSNIIGIPQDSGQILTFTWTPNSELTFIGNVPVAKPVGVGLHTYFFEVKNLAGCILHDSVSLFVVDTSAIEFVDIQQCSGTKVLFEGTGINKEYYNWEVEIGDSSLYFFSSGFVVNFPDSGTYKVKAWLPGLDCVDTLIRDIYVTKSIIDPSIQIDVSNCIDSLNITLVNSTAGYNPSVHTLEWILDNGIKSNKDSLLLSFDSIIPDFQVKLIIDQHNGCIDTISKSVYISNIPTITNDTFVICKGQEIGLNTHNLDWLNFFWIPQSDFVDNTAPHPIVKPLVSTLYTAQLSAPAIDSFVCSSSFNVLVNVLDKPDLIQVYDSLICQKTTTLQILTDTSATINWFEDKNFQIITATGPQWEVSPGRPSIYYSIITFPNGCADTTEFKVFSQLPQIDPAKILICEGDTADLSVKSLFPEDTLVCIWGPVEKIILDPVTGNQSVTSDVDLDLTVNCTNQFGCSISDTIQLDVFNYKPPLTLTATPDSVNKGGTTQLIATNDPGYTYYWSPVTGLSSTNIYNPTATVFNTTEYKVEIVNEDGCRNEAFIRIVVINCEEPFSFIPSAFSPNGDGKNDVFILRGDFIKSVDLKVFNRWGDMVFYSTDKNVGWDGTYKGEILGPDVFGYVLEFICEDGLHFLKKGNVSIIK